jgi:hypothetical protein
MTLHDQAIYLTNHPIDQVVPLLTKHGASKSTQGVHHRVDAPKPAFFHTVSTRPFVLARMGLVPIYMPVGLLLPVVLQ